MNARVSSAPVGLAGLSLEAAYTVLPASFYTRLAPQGLPEPRLAAHSPAAAALLDLDPALFAEPTVADYFAGNRLLPGSDPLAAVYSGHQFGVWAGQLGDGRAHLLGACKGWEIQLKGAGRTPYSRGADGRAVLRSSIREFLCSEAMAALGIPTTRALCLVVSPMQVRRERFESAAVVTRLAPSFVRFGSFEHWGARDRLDELRQLADYVIDRFRPLLRAAANPYLALLEDVARRTGELLAQWMAVGFMHGVMNTDNMSILGLTLDYGPFGFMDYFDPEHVCNHSDDYGRYAYRAQPQVAHWNLYALGDALLPLLGRPEEVAAAIDAAYWPAYDTAYLALMRGKLGLVVEEADDPALVAATLELLRLHRIDYTTFFRALCDLPDVTSPQDAVLCGLRPDCAEADRWLASWRARLVREERGEGDRQVAMRAVNPRYVLRNWLAEQAIRDAEAGDFTTTERLRSCLEHPFDEQPDCVDYAAPPPGWAEGLAVSCSS
jgi:serine/tyrosine/threonine adenylyltransferase